MYVEEKGTRTELRRAQLADTTLKTLAEMGYARTSVREIAHHSPFSHGVLHYYFKNKDELIVEAVRLFKERSSRRYDAILDEASTGDELAHGLAGVHEQAITECGTEQRLWYDLRAQAMYDRSFRDEVLGIDRMLADLTWRLVTRYAELCRRPVVVSRELAYSALDGVFQKALLDHLAGVPDASACLRKVTPTVLDLFLQPG